MNNSCLITGGPTGIGRATALAFAKEGASLLFPLGGRRRPKVALEIAKNGAEAELTSRAFTPRRRRGKLDDKSVERFGSLDVAVKNAG